MSDVAARILAMMSMSVSVSVSASWNASLFQEMNANEMSVVRDRSLNINPVSVCLNITVGLQVVVYILADVAKTRVTSTMQSAALPAPYIN